MPTLDQIIKSRPSEDAPLQDHVNWFVARKYRVVSQTETSAQLVKPKTFSFVWAFLWFLGFGIGLVVYLIYYAAKKDQQAYLVVTDGKVVLTGAKM